MKSIDIFLQGHGLTDIAVLIAKPDDTIANVLAKLQRPQAGEGRLGGTERAADLARAAARVKRARQAPTPPENVISLEKM